MVGMNLSRMAFWRLFTYTRKSNLPPRRWITFTVNNDADGLLTGAGEVTLQLWNDATYWSDHVGTAAPKLADAAAMGVFSVGAGTRSFK